MIIDKYSAIWVSYTQINDFLKCPRAFFLKNVYRDPRTGHKIKIITPPLALGQIIHEVIESLSNLPTAVRFQESPVNKLALIWPKISGKLGGFINQEIESQYKKRGEEMLLRIMSNPGPLAQLAVKIRMEPMPYFWLSEKDRIILCGKVDWLEYLPEIKSIHVIDFKTSKYEEDNRSLQLDIYYLLASHCQKYPVVKVSYWYIERSDKPIEKPLPDRDEAKEKVLDVAKKIKLARQLSRFKCLQENGCSVCRPMEMILRGEAEYVGVNSYGEDIYVLERTIDNNKETSFIL